MIEYVMLLYLNGAPIEIQTWRSLRECDNNAITVRRVLKELRMDQSIVMCAEREKEKNK